MRFERENGGALTLSLRDSVYPGNPVTVTATSQCSRVDFTLTEIAQRRDR